jgi:pyruvate/2-oxoglutarate dehydrogenase complex dihydrolipoamide dehydrogenase (E3) component
VRSLLDGSEQSIAADTLVLSTTNTSERSVLTELGDRVPEVHAAGDAVAARLAVHAIYEGRVIAMTL